MGARGGNPRTFAPSRLRSDLSKPRQGETTPFPPVPPFLPAVLCLSDRNTTGHHADGTDRASNTRLSCHSCVNRSKSTRFRAVRAEIGPNRPKSRPDGAIRRRTRRNRPPAAPYRDAPPSSRPRHDPTRRSTPARAAIARRSLSHSTPKRDSDGQVAWKKSVRATFRGQGRGAGRSGSGVLAMAVERGQQRRGVVRLTTSQTASPAGPPPWDRPAVPAVQERSNLGRSPPGYRPPIATVSID